MASGAIGRLSATSRIRKRTEFREVQAQAVRVTTAHFVFLLHMPQLATPRPLPRLGITASRRVGGAVQRNRAKRLVREAFRSTRELWQPGVDVVVIVRSALGTMKLEQVVAEWRDASAALSKASERSARSAAPAQRRSA